MDISLINFIENDRSVFDIDYDSSGDFIKDNLDTANYIGLFANAKANESEVAVAEQRQGCWIKTIDDKETGSKLWLEDGRKTIDNMGRILDYSEKGLQFLINEKLVKKIENNAVFIQKGIKLEVEETLLDNTTITKNYVI